MGVYYTIWSPSLAQSIEYSTAFSFCSAEDNAGLNGIIYTGVRYEMNLVRTYGYILVNKVKLLISSKGVYDKYIRN